MSALNDIAAERHRQSAMEGWDNEHDDSHTNGELALAAAAYVIAGRPVHTDDPRRKGASVSVDPLNLWPWSRDWWKPSDVRRNLVRAAALLVAEIERLDRKSVAETRRADGGG